MKKFLAFCLVLVFGAGISVSAYTSDGTSLKGECLKAVGIFESQILSPDQCPGPICTKGALIGSLWGDYEFTGNKLLNADEPSIPNVWFFTGFSRVKTLKGDLYLTDAGALDMSKGRLSSLLLVSGGTGDYSLASGYLHVFGGVEYQSAKGKFEGVICK